MPTANYTAKADAFERRVQWCIEIDLDRCDNVIGSAPCTVSPVLGDGSRCYYSFATCQDATNFTKVQRTYRFCLSDVPWSDLSNPAYPYLTRIVDVPQKISAAKLWTFPQKIKAVMARDFLPRPMDSDKGVDLHNTTTAGEFWANLLARNRTWPDNVVRIKKGFAGLALADFSKVGPDYLLRAVKMKAGTVEITAESPLVKLNEARIPFSINQDNTLQSSITDVATSATALDGSEFPDPADYTQNTVYVRLESEIVSVTTIATNTLTIVRGRLGTTAVAHNAGVKIEHVCFFGTDNGDNAPSERNVAEVMLDLLEWAGIASADTNEGTFRVIKNQAWPRDDLYRLLTKPKRVSKLLQPLRESRGIVIFIDAAGDFAARSMGPNEEPTDISDETITEDSILVSDDSDARLTRVGLWYGPSDPDTAGDDPKDYTRAVLVIDAELEAASNYDGKKNTDITDPWQDADATVADVRLVARRLITRRRHGERTVKFTLDVKDATFEVGDSVRLLTRAILGRDGLPISIHGIVIETRQSSRAEMEYTVADVAFGGRYMRIGPDTMSDTYDAATDSDLTYGYWGDADGRVGSVKDEGYLYY